MQDDSFQLTTRLDLSGMKPGTNGGLAIFEHAASGLAVTEGTTTGRRLRYFHLSDETPGPLLTTATLQLRVVVQDVTASYSYSLDDGRTFQPLGAPTAIHSGWWKGPRPALFAFTTAASAPGFVDFDWVHYEPTGPNPW